MKRSTLAACIAGAIGLLLTGLATFAYIYFPSIIKNRIELEFPLREGSESYQRWLVVEEPLFFKVTIFHVRNPKDVEQGTAKPIVVERGPYYFDERRYKKKISWDDPEFITYRNGKRFTFNANKSVGSLDDHVVVPNVPVISISAIVDKMIKPGNPLRDVVIGLLNPIFNSNKEALFVNVKVRQLLFEGYTVKFLNEIRKSLGSYDVKIPQLDKLTKFALFMDKDGLETDTYTINTGVNDITKYAKIVSYNNMTQLRTYEKNSKCNQIIGTDGAQYPPGVTPETPLHVFVGELCRALPLAFKRHTRVEKIPALSFEISRKAFAAPEFSEFECFCHDKSSPYCQIDGLIDVSKCRQGAPIAISLPHFLHGNEKIIAKIDGLRPSLDKHDSYINIEPMTGLVIGAEQKIQLNMLIKPLKSIEIMSQVKEMVMPVLWIAEGASIPKDKAEMFRGEVLDRITSANIILFTFIGVGILLIIIAITLVILNRIREKKRKPVIEITIGNPDTKLIT